MLCCICYACQHPAAVQSLQPCTWARQDNLAHGICLQALQALSVLVEVVALDLVCIPALTADCSGDSFSSGDLRVCVCKPVLLIGDKDNPVPSRGKMTLPLVDPSCQVLGEWPRPDPDCCLHSGIRVTRDYQLHV